MKTRLSIITGIGFATGLAAFIWLSGSRNPMTGAGYVGYLTQGAIFGQTRFYGLQKGPTSPGRTWLLDVVNVSVTPYTYSEDFADKQSVLSKDNLKISFRVHVVWKVREDRVKEFVERYSTLYSNEHSDRIVETAYANFLREPLRTFARDEIQKLNGLEVKEQFTPIGDAVLRRVHTLTTNSPFEIASVVVGNVQYPETVAAAVAEKLAATQVLERKRTEIEIAQADAAKRIVEAEGIARSMQIINERLTVTYLQHEAIEAQKAMVGSPNHTTIYIPVGAMGVPVVDLVDKGRSDSVATTKAIGPSAR
jgi:regulator of protease activity HflC (stomatin/prohibitin superfamily)